MSTSQPSDDFRYPGSTARKAAIACMAVAAICLALALAFAVAVDGWGWLKFLAGGLVALLPVRGLRKRDMLLHGHWMLDGYRTRLPPDHALHLPKSTWPPRLP